MSREVNKVTRSEIINNMKYRYLLSTKETVTYSMYTVCNFYAFPENISSQKTLKWVIDMTVGYPGANPYNSHGMFVGYWPPHQIEIHYRVYPIDEVPQDKEGLTKWMYERYQEKEVLLQEFYTKSKPLDESDDKKRYMTRVKRHDLEVDVIVAILYHLLHLCSFILFWYYLYSPVFRILNYFRSFVF